MRALSAWRCLAYVPGSRRVAVCQACFSTSIRSHKRPLRSPTVRRSERATEQGVARPPPSEKWPMQLLEQIVVRIPCFAGSSTRDLVAILDHVQTVDPSKAKEHAKRIISEHDISAYNLFILGLHLRRLNHVKYNTVGTTLQLLCLESEQKGHDLCFKVIQVTLTQGTLKNPKIFSLLKLLKDLAHQGYPRAVFLQGQIFEQEGKLQEALQFYQEWTDIFAEARQSPPFSDSMDTRDLANISKALARLQARFGDLTGAEEAIRDAALAYDDPAAYYYLAVDFTAPGSKDFETYLLRAASAGQAKAAHELGSLYVNRSRQGIPPTSTNPVSSDKNAPATPRHPTTPPTQTLPRDEILSLRATAAEWFAVAAAAGLTASQIGLALLSRAAGRADEGFASLQSASQSKHAGEWTEGIDYLKKIWRHPDAPDLMQVDIESLRKSSSKNGKKNKKSGGLSLSDDVSSSLTESERSMGPLT